MATPSSSNFTNSSLDIPTSSTFDPTLRPIVSVLMGVAGLLSCMGALFVILCSFKFNLHKKRHYRYLLYLAFSDLFQSVASLSSWAWIYEPPLIGVHRFCIFQGFMFQYGNVSSAIASACIGISLFIQLFAFDFKWMTLPGKKFEIGSVLCTFGGALLFALIGFTREAVTGNQFYAPVGFSSWCWISDKYPLERLMLHYTWIFFICVLLFFLYLYMAYVLYRSSQISQAVQKDSSPRVSKLFGFPILFSCVFVPLGIERLIKAISPSTRVPSVYLAFAVCIFVLNGFFNAILYGITRKVFHGLCLGKSNKSKSKSQSQSPYTTY